MNRFTRHGGALDAAIARFGNGPLAWMDLSTGINPNGWPYADEVAIDWARLPGEGDLAALETAAAAYFGLDAAHVCALPGTEIGLRLAGGLLPEPAHYLVPAYRTHGEMFGAAAAPLPRDAWQAAETGTLILANPANPDGHVIPREGLLAMLAERDPAAWLLVDEAFADPDPALSLADRIADDRPLVLFRSFGKFFGLAGVRLGFVLGPRPLIERMRARLGAWPVSAAAVAIGTEAYRDRDWIAEARNRLHGGALALDVALRRAGFSPRGECPLFRLIETQDAGALFERLGRQAILTRPFEDEPRWLRFGLPADEGGFARLAHALAQHG